MLNNTSMATNDVLRLKLLILMIDCSTATNIPDGGIHEYNKFGFITVVVVD